MNYESFHSTGINAFTTLRSNIPLKRQKLAFNVGKKPFEPRLAGLAPLVTTNRDNNYSLGNADGKFAFLSHCNEVHTGWKSTYIGYYECKMGAGGQIHFKPV